MEAARLDIMDAQRFDPSKRTSNRSELTVRTGGNEEDASTAPATPRSWVTFLEPCIESSSSSDSDAGSVSIDEESSTPPTSLQSSITLEDALDPKSIQQFDVFDKGDSITTRTIIRPVPRAGCFSRPSSPVTSRPTSPINFAALNCFTGDAFAEEVDYLQEKRAQELAGQACALEVRVQRQIVFEVEMPYIVQKTVDPEGLRRRKMGNVSSVSCP
ncbi:hypothetical protein FB45DRAFT_860894 [Roridomyces roridus]|uniref:Uncharacterized protein n=1 Tax=Roridomyces roridus TaxID=1738132 RepID=A0AAD7CGE2_9AGAR|nr:hypothetical protein FB45DRAFT_860894 [Roridomyces roridus]